MNESLY